MGLFVYSPPFQLASAPFRWQQLHHEPSSPLPFVQFGRVAVRVLVRAFGVSLQQVSLWFLLFHDLTDVSQIGF